MKKEKKLKRTSFDLTDENSKLLAEFSEKMDAPYSHVINYMLRIFLKLSPEIKKSMADFCTQKMTDICDNLDLMSDFEKENAKNDMHHYQELAYFFYDAEFRPLYKKEKNMKKIYLKKGYVIVPNNWIVLDNFSDPTENMFAGVVETRQPLDGSKTFDAKHYLFFTNYQYGKHYPSNLADKVFDACVEKDADFKKILNAVVEPIYPEGSPELLPNMLNEAEYKSAPCPGLFHIVEKGDPTYWHQHNQDYVPPHGAMIIR